jgi:hypothetical protein
MPHWRKYGCFFVWPNDGYIQRNERQESLWPGCFVNDINVVLK